MPLCFYSTSKFNSSSQGVRADVYFSGIPVIIVNHTQVVSIISKHVHINIYGSKIKSLSHRYQYCHLNF